MFRAVVRIYRECLSILFLITLAELSVDPDAFRSRLFLETDCYFHFVGVEFFCVRIMPEGRSAYNIPVSCMLDLVILDLDGFCGDRFDFRLFGLAGLDGPGVESRAFEEIALPVIADPFAVIYPGFVFLVGFQAPDRI